jgi:hypothetical protein
MLVELSRPTTVSIDDVHVTGAGRFSGIVLEQDRRSPQAVLLLITQGMCLTPGCRSSLGWGGSGCVCVISSDGKVTGDRGTLPAGRYRLYLVTDGAPVRARLVLHGLAGRVTLRPGGSFRQSIVAPRPEQALPAEGPLAFAAGSSHVFGARGGYFTGVVWKNEPLPQEVNAVGECDYVGRPPSGPVPVYQETCGGEPSVPWPTGVLDSGQKTQLTPGTPALPYYTSFYYSTHAWYRPTGGPVGPVSVGYYDNTAGPVMDGHFIALWVDRP